MSFASLQSRALLGFQAQRVRVEVHLANGLPSFTLVGRVLVPVPKLDADWKVPLPLPNSTLALLEPRFDVTISSLPSPFTSPSVTLYGSIPVPKLDADWKVPLPLPRSTLALLEI